MIINCAAFTNVDLAEKYKKNCIEVNYYSIINLAKLCKKNRIILVHFSTDYVFDGKKNSFYNERSKTNPLNYYGLTKLKADNAILKIKPPGIIIRTSWVYSIYGNNFVKTILQLLTNNKEINVVKDQFGSPTSAKDIADVLIKILYSRNLHNLLRNVSIYNLSGNIRISWYEFACEILKYSKINKKINPISSHEYKFNTLRPKNSSLECSKIIKRFNIKIPKWNNSLKKCIMNMSKK